MPWSVQQQQPGATAEQRERSFSVCTSQGQPKPRAAAAVAFRESLPETPQSAVGARRVGMVWRPTDRRTDRPTADVSRHGWAGCCEPPPTITTHSDPSCRDGLTCISVRVTCVFAFSGNDPRGAHHFSVVLQLFDRFQRVSGSTECSESTVPEPWIRFSVYTSMRFVLISVYSVHGDRGV